LGSYERERLDAAITARTVVGVTQAAATAAAGLGVAGLTALGLMLIAPDAYDTGSAIVKDVFTRNTKIEGESWGEYARRQRPFLWWSDLVPEEWRPF
jgi:hypothetical protein